jgi:hypothetical protein
MYRSLLLVAVAILVAVSRIQQAWEEQEAPMLRKQSYLALVMRNPDGFSALFFRLPSFCLTDLY